MPGITVKGADAAGGTQLAGQNSTWTLDGMPFVLAGDPVAGHGQPPHSAPVMTGGSAWFTLDGIPVIRAGDVATCGHATSGQSAWDIA